jgi:hypothetical protein
VTEASVADVGCGHGRAQAAFPAWEGTPASERAAALDARRRPDAGTPAGTGGADRPRRRADAGRRGLRGARGDRFLPLLRRAGKGEILAADPPARPDRRAQQPVAARPRRLRLHQSVEFPAGDLCRPDRRGTGRRQYRRRQAGRADAAGRRAGRRAAAHAGIPGEALAFLPGDGRIGAALVAAASVPAWRSPVLPRSRD